VKTGDIILAIDGVDTGKLVLPDVRERIRREAAGSTLTLLLESQGKPRVAMISLRDLV
jgi:C-terminal processing protease CtpA/Prc